MQAILQHSDAGTTLTNDEILALLEKADAAGEDIYDIAVNAGLKVAGEMDTGKWLVGDLACLVDKRYGKDMIGQFAIAINLEKARVKDYRRVCGFWQKDARAAFLEIPVISYSHMRQAMRLGNLPEASAFLEEVADNAWTVEQAGIELTKRLGKPEPAAKLMDVTTLSCTVSPTLEDITFKILPMIGLDAARALKAHLAAGKPVRLVLYEGK